MPQTLLAIMAIFTAGLFTMSQVETQHSTVESVVRDQFELAVAGTLLHTMEFVDSRAFDAATTPGALRNRYDLGAGLTIAERDTVSFDDLLDIRVEEFSPVAAFGGSCDIVNPTPSASTPSCDDIDDVHSDEWQPVDLTTTDGHTLPVEVRVAISYVEAADGAGIDTPVNFKTNHKRVEIFARTTHLKSRSGKAKPIEVSLRRVISFDTKVAAAYLRRSIAANGEGGPTCEGNVGAWNARKGELTQIRDDATRAYSAAAAGLEDAQGALASVQGRYDAAADALASAQRDQAAAQSDYDAAVQDERTAADALEDARRTQADADGRISAAETALTDAQQAEDRARRARVAADETVADAEADFDAALEVRSTELDEANTAIRASNAALEDARNADDAADRAYSDGRVRHNGQWYWRSQGHLDNWRRLDRVRDDAWDTYQTRYAAAVAAVEDFRDAHDAAVATFGDLEGARERAAAATTALEVAEADLAGARRDLEDARSDRDDAGQTISDAESALEDARDARAQAASDLEDARDAVAGAQAALDGLQSDLDASRATAGQASADAQAAQARAVEAQEDLDAHQATRPECDDPDGDTDDGEVSG